MTMVEVLIALLLAGIVAAAALSIAFTCRGLYTSDRGRTDLNQNLRSAIDLLGMELRQTGERLPLDVPAVEIVNGGGSNPDTLIVRRNLLDAVLPVCEQLPSGGTVGHIRVAVGGGSPPAGGAPVPDADYSGWPDNVDELRAYRDANGGSVAVYVFNPVSGLGEFIDFDGDGSTNEYLAVSSSGNWQNEYQITQQCRVYMLEQHTYRLSSGMLQYLDGNDTANPVNLVHGLTDFQVRVLLSGGGTQDSYGPSDDWRQLQNIEVTLTGQSSNDKKTVTRSTTTGFFPRNVLSL
jgi:type II secretory pathway pseudopilin PulG